ncbi:MAG: alpha/beta hydrolase-fold protein [Acidobacteriota bacterium]|nr:alpha/beta hydrolase-fold protein [Acidobacteriota bacterium]
MSAEIRSTASSPEAPAGRAGGARWEPARDGELGERTPIERVERHWFHSAERTEPEVREVVVYLPPQYAQHTDRRFPVFYLQDGQNLVDPTTSYVPGQTWRAHETADRLALAGESEPVILVGVANGGARRMAEYTPGRDLRMGGGEGRSYGRMLIEELKPLVDAQYRTLPGPQDTALGGSSLGALISLFLGLERPDVFGNIAVMSPSVWWDQRSILARLSRAVPRPPLRIWLDIGTEEGAPQVRDVGMLYRQLVRQGWCDGVDLEYFLAEGAQHTEDAWAARFDRVLRFLFPAGRPREGNSQGRHAPGPGLVR